MLSMCALSGLGLIVVKQFGFRVQVQPEKEN